ncbi:MAG: DUF3849 domain-containing protein [Clostridia bacterium]|nr:DUF3849 domain-containing protein [Clostridia bacterium]
MLIYEARQGNVTIEANTEQEAKEKLRAMYKAGDVQFSFVTNVDSEVLETTRLRNVALPRFEIFDKQALFADMARSNIEKLQGTDKLYRYDLRHGDDDGIPLTLERQVIVNRFATIFTAEPLLAEGEDRREIGEDDWSFLSDLDDITPEQFYMEMQQEKEKAIMREYEIFQLKDSARAYLFMNSAELAQMGVQPNIENYQPVYKGTLEPGMNMESIYMRLNADEKPEGYTGHSLSVSDVIVVSDENGKTAWMVDSVGFSQVYGFFTEREQQQTVDGEGEKTYPPLYRRTADYARETGMISEYRASMQENIACKQAIEEAIRMGFDGMNLKDGIAADILDRFGAERVSWVLGNTVTQQEHDGRFSYRNKVWAQAMNIPVDKDGFGHLRNWNYQVTTHPAVLDGFIDLTRKEMEKPSKQRTAEKDAVREDVKPSREMKADPQKPAKRRSEPSL